MVTKKELTEEFNRVSAQKDVLETYEEIAATHMQNVRSSVLVSRLFIEELNSISQQVKSSYKEQVLKMMKKKKIKDLKELTFIEKNGKTLYVLLSSNTGLYGDIIRQTFNLFLGLVKQENADAAIIGRIGYELFENSGVKKPYAKFELPDSNVDNTSFKKIIDYIIQYKKVFIVYGKFETLVSQKPVVIGLYDDPLLFREQSGTKVRYFFEPSLDKIMKFFEAQIFTSLFEQTVFESQLAKFASRMTSLELRVEKTKAILKDIFLEKEKVRHRIINKKQLETFSSMSLWSQNG